ncbi:alpha/beta fold hydrolase [Nonomuraea purpurea]|uniref:Alpha/beta fold hydrolase n=1 Tax=Nonomuraea purpurea TaxID=1849276 RepID=A0ABV8G750_9ACTN
MRLLLLHPLGSDGRCWDEVAARLDGVETLAMDLPGHGTAACLPRGAGIGVFADTVAEALAGERVHVAGLSLGGLVAQELAARHPALVERVVLADTVDVYPEPMRQMWRERASVARDRGLAELAEPMAAMWFTDAFRAGGSRTPERIRELFLAMDPEGYARACEALEAADTTALVPAIKAPALVVCGSADLPPFTEAARRLHGELRRSELVWMAGAKHAAALERPAEFAAAVRAFLTAA